MDAGPLMPLLFNLGLNGRGRRSLTQRVEPSGFPLADSSDTAPRACHPWPVPARGAYAFPCVFRTRRARTIRFNMG